MILEAFAELVSKNKNEANLFFEKYQKQRLKFFQNRITELNELYTFSKDEERTLWGELLAAEQPQINTNNQVIKILHNLNKLEIEKEFVENSEIYIAFIGWLKTYWSTAWRKYADVNKHMLSARFTIIKRKTHGDKTANLHNAEDELIKELKKAFISAESFINIDSNNININNVKELDNQVLKYFKEHNIGPATRSLITNLTKINSNKDYDLKNRAFVWDNPLHFWQLIAACRWLDYTKRFVHEIQDKPAALTIAILRQISNTMKKGNKLDEETKSIVNTKGNKVIGVDLTACINVITAKSILRSGIPLLSSVTSYYVVTWLLIQVHKQFIMNHKEPRKIIFQGDAFKKLGEASGAGVADATVAKLRQIIPALSSCIFQYKSHDRIGEGNFLSYRYEKAIGRNDSILEIELQPIVCPGFVQSLPSGGIEFQEQRQMIPILNLFPFYGKRKDLYAPQAHFQTELLIELRANAKELYKRGGVCLTNTALNNIAERAELPSKLINPVLDLWINENYITRSSDNLYNVGEREINAKKMLELAGKYEIEGSKSGKKRSRAKRTKLASK